MRNRKILMVILGMILLGAGVAYAACTSTASCADLGYVFDGCSSGFKTIKCPFDTTKVACLPNG